MSRFSPVALVAALSVVLAVPAFVSPAGAAKHDPACLISPGSVSLDHSYTVFSWGLPSGPDVNLIITFPNGSTLTSPITVASGGTFTLTRSSADAIPAEQTGAYNYQFVGRVKWPQGTFNQSYASCSVTVS